MWLWAEGHQGRRDILPTYPLLTDGKTETPPQKQHTEAWQCDCMGVVMGLWHELGGCVCVKEIGDTWLALHPLLHLMV